MYGIIKEPNIGSFIRISRLRWLRYIGKWRIVEKQRDGYRVKKLSVPGYEEDHEFDGTWFVYYWNS